MKIHLKHIFEKTGIRGRYGLALSGLKHKGLLAAVTPTQGYAELRTRYHEELGLRLSQISFEILAECPQTRARAGLLHTAHGDIETPVFMPVGTQATVKGLTQRDLADDLTRRSSWQHLSSVSAARATS